MWKRVPVRGVLLTAWIGLVFSSAFGWLVLKAARDLDGAGPLGRAALFVATFPDFAGFVLSDARRQIDESARYEAVRVPLPDIDSGGFTQMESDAGVHVDGLLYKTASQGPEPGWRVIAGLFSINGDYEHAALLLGPDLSIRKIWRLYEPIADGQSERRQDRTIVHGFEILPDLSIVYVFVGDDGIQKVDFCGNLVWRTEGRFHHNVAADDSAATIWTLRNETEEESGRARKDQYAEKYYISNISASDGKILRQFSMQDIIDQNPDIDILEIRRDHRELSSENERGEPGEWLHDPFHVNDAEPLSVEFAAQFPRFETGDLLISVRSLNLIFVMDPDTLKIRWWRAGAVKHQHDPDWMPDGHIRILNNRTSRGFSTIVDVDPKDFSTKVIYDGLKSDFYTRIAGRQQTLPDGNVLIASEKQARVFEVNRNGQTVLDILNTNPSTEGEGLDISEVIWLPPDALPEDLNKCD
ncbi:MAG: arylsulfotransferase family protein [Paracoccaceae bacterium]